MFLYAVFLLSPCSSRSLIDNVTTMMSKAWFSLGHKHKDRRRRRKPEFSIPAPLDVKQDGGRHGGLPCACAYAYVAPFLISKKCDISISIRRTEAFVFLMLMLMSQVFSLALVALLLMLMS